MADEDNYVSQDIFQSIRSDDSDEFDQPGKQPNYNNFNSKIGFDDQEIQIKQTLKSRSVSPKDNKSKISNRSGMLHERHMERSDNEDWNDTDEIIHDPKKQPPKKQSKIRYPTFAEPVSDPSQKYEGDDWEDTEEVHMKNSNKFSEQSQQFDDSEIIDIGRSMYTSKQSSNFSQPQPVQNSPLKKQQPKFFPLEKLKPEQYNQSIHLFDPVNKKSTSVEFKVMDRRMYWKYNHIEIEIVKEVLQALVQQFLKIQILLPLISEAQMAAEYIALYMNKYTEYLNKMYKIQFKKILAIIKEQSVNKNKLTVYNSSAQVKSPTSSSASMTKFFDTKILTGHRYSKVEMLKNYMSKKLKATHYAEEYFKSKHNPRQSLAQRESELILNQIMDLELFISFENAENECKNNSSKGIDQKIWKEHGKKITEARKKWVKTVEEEGNPIIFTA